MSKLEDYPIVVERAVRWGDMDAFQHVNNVEYFRYFEDARIAYFRAMEIYDPKAQGVLPEEGPILAATSCRFLAPLAYPDQILIGARTEEIREDRFVMAYAVVGERTGRIVAVGDSEIVPYNYREGHKIDVPEAWRRAIDDLENG